MKNKYLLSILLFFTSLLTRAQVEMADDFRGEGKIYVVIAIILVILAGFFFLLFRLDRHTKNMEKRIEIKGDLKSE